MTLTLIEFAPVGPSPHESLAGCDEVTPGSAAHSVTLVDEIHIPATRLVDHELAGLVDTACLKFPQHDRAVVAAVVAEAHRHLAEHASVTTHLIPLTLNRSLRLLRRSR